MHPVKQPAAARNSAVTAHAHRIQLTRLSPDGRFQATRFRLPHGGLLGTVSELTEFKSAKLPATLELADMPLVCDDDKIQVHEVILKPVPHYFR